MENNKLKKVKDLPTIIALLSGTKERSAEVFIWKLIGNVKHLAQVRIEAIRKLRKDFCISPVEGQEVSVQEMMSGDHFVDLFIPDSALLLRCTIKSTDAPVRYYLHIPEFVAQVDRRKELRLFVHDKGEVKVSFEKSMNLPKPVSQHFLKDCLDVSTGGFSFYVSKLEAKFFEVSDSIAALEIKAGKWSAKVKAEVATVREVEPDEFNGLSYKVWKISCRFTQIDQISRKYLEKFIFERIKSDLHAIND